MSYAEMMGHNIPDYDMDQRTGYHDSDYISDIDWKNGSKLIITEDTSLVHETDKAYLMLNNKTNDKIWLPKSQVVYDEINKQFLIPQWLLDKLIPIEE